MIDKKLRRRISGRRVLILGSGPSIAHLTSIPNDVLIFACNTSPQFLLKNNISKTIDLYLCRTAAAAEKKHFTDLQDLFSKIKIDFFATNDKKFMKKSFQIKNQKYFTDFTTGKYPNNYLTSLLLPELFHPAIFSRKTQAGSKGTSAGTGLIQYAEYYGAKEIILAGVDYSDNGYAFSNKKNNLYTAAHKNDDISTLIILKDKYQNIFTASKESPLSKIIPIKNL